MLGEEVLLFTPMLSLPPPEAMAVTLFMLGEELSLLFTP
jgi:hypothetical protein